MTNLAWSIGLAVIGLIGMHIAGRKSQWGWFIGLSAQVLWVIFALTTAQYGFLLSAAGYGWVYGNNWWKWRKEHHKTEHVDRSADWSV
jgi:nicotinamide riboside transporter PnuC